MAKLLLTKQNQMVSQEESSTLQKQNPSLALYQKQD